jgi:hypothetical protein
MKTFLRIIAIILLVNLGIAAIYGSWMLVSDPSGGKFDWSVDLLRNTPFSDFLIPGIILGIMNGLLSLCIAVVVIMKVHKHEWLLILQGCILIGWLTIEILLNRDLFVPVMHYPCYGTGILLIIIGIVLLRRTGTRAI